MATDNVAGIYEKLYALLAGHGPFYPTAVKRIIRYDDTTDAFPQPNSIQSGDVVEAELDYEGGEDHGYLETLHYGDNQSTTPATDAWSEPGAHLFVVTLTLPDWRLIRANAAYSALKVALRNGGPTLGLSYVQQWGPLHRSDELRSGDEGDHYTRGSRRRVVAVRIPVSTILQGNTELS